MTSTKRLIVSIAILLMTTGAATAETGAKLYGKLHMSLETYNDGENNWAGVSSNGSRFGFKGTQGMNENFGLIWQFEQSVNIAQKGAETLATRNSFLGLNGSWGTALCGIHDTPFKTVGSKFTFFRDEIGDFRQSTLHWDRRLQDIVLYVTPDLSGFEGRLLYQADQTGGQADQAQSVFSSSLQYRSGGLFVGAAYENLSKGHAASTWIDPSGSEDVVRTVYGNSASGIRVGGKYVTGKLGVAALFQSLADYNQSDFAVNENDPGVAVANDLQGTAFGGEVRYEFAAKFAAKVEYYATDPDTDTDDDEYNLFGIGVDHLYAKDLWFYLQYAVKLNGDTTKESLGCKCDGHGKNIAAAAAGESPVGISLGIAKKF